MIKIFHPSKRCRKLISDHVIRYPVGIHPSWRSGDDKILLKKEIETLSEITGNKLFLPGSIIFGLLSRKLSARLIDQGIQFDFSMGYGSINGFGLLWLPFLLV